MFRTIATPTQEPGKHVNGVDTADINEKPMKILVVTPYFFPLVGGAELLIYEIFKRIAKKASVTVLSPKVTGRIEAVWGSDHPVDLPFQVVQFENRLCLTQVPGQRFIGGLPPVSISALRAILKECRRQKPDVIFCFYAKAVGLPALAASKLYGCPVIQVICGTDLASGNQPALWPAYGRFILRHADKAVYVSRFSERLFWGVDTPSLPNSQIIPNGVDMTLFNSRVNGEAARKKLNIKTNEVMLLAMQRLAPGKRVDVIIKSMPYILKKHSEVKLVIAGIGSQLESLKRLTAQMELENQVLFAGFLGSERNQYLAAADTCIIHSCMEAFGLVLAEAMAMGKPIITVNNSAIPEIVQNNITAVFYRTLNERDLADKVIRLVENPKLAKQMGHVAEAKARQDLDIEIVVNQYYAIASTLLATANHNRRRYMHGVLS